MIYSSIPGELISRHLDIESAYPDGPEKFQIQAQCK